MVFFLSKVELSEQERNNKINNKKIITFNIKNINNIYIKYGLYLCYIQKNK